MADIHYMTADGLEKLKKELADALAQRPVISAAIAEAREKGDLSENAEYDAAREAQGLLELKIAKLQNQENAYFLRILETSTDALQQGFNSTNDEIVVRDFDAACYSNDDLYRDVRNLYNRFIDDLSIETVLEDG